MGVGLFEIQVDGLGSALVDFDDPNLPSLLSIPLLGYRHYDEGIYRATVQRLLSKNNSYFFQGAEIEGLGSPHTGPEMVWPLAVMVQVRFLALVRKSLSVFPPPFFRCWFFFLPRLRLHSSGYPCSCCSRLKFQHGGIVVGKV